MKALNFSPVKYRKYNSSFPNVFDEFFNRDLGRLVGQDATHSIPAVNVSEDESGYTIDLAVPGYSKDDFEVNVDNDRLTIKGERKEEKDSPSVQYNRREFNYSTFSRSFNLPKEANSKAIEGNYVNGILNVRIAKLTDKEKGVHTVKIK